MPCSNFSVLSDDMILFRFLENEMKNKQTNKKKNRKEKMKSRGAKKIVQFVIFKPLNYCFEETIEYDVKASFESRPESRLIR